MGHSSITVTMDTYGHLFPRGDDAAELATAEAALLEVNATQTQHAGRFTRHNNGHSQTLTPENLRFESEFPSQI